MKNVLSRPTWSWRESPVARKPTDTVKLQLRLQENLRRRLERVAARNNRSMNTEIIHRLEESVQREAEERELIPLIRAALAQMSQLLERGNEERARDVASKAADEAKKIVDKFAGKRSATDKGE
jgi:hypothetical protein